MGKGKGKGKSKGKGKGNSKGKKGKKKGDSKGKGKDKHNAVVAALAARQEQSARDKAWNEGWTWVPPSPRATANAATKPPHKTFSTVQGEYCLDKKCEGPNVCGKAHNPTCNKWLTGCCTAGKQCPFIHKKDVVGRTPKTWKQAVNKAWKAQQKAAAGAAQPGHATMAMTVPAGGDAAPVSK